MPIPVFFSSIGDGTVAVHRDVRGIRPSSVAKPEPAAFILDERESASRAVNMAQRELRAARILLDGLHREGLSTSDPYYVGCRLRFIMADTATREAQRWLNAVRLRKLRTGES
jgi:hypothetical protein